MCCEWNTNTQQIIRAVLKSCYLIDDRIDDSLTFSEGLQLYTLKFGCNPL